MTTATDDKSNRMPPFDAQTYYEEVQDQRAAESALIRERDVPKFLQHGFDRPLISAGEWWLLGFVFGLVLIVLIAGGTAIGHFVRQP